MPLVEDRSRRSSMAVAGRSTTAPIAAVPAIVGTGRSGRRSATSASINWIAVTDATATTPNRASFTIALNTTRDQLTRAAAVLAEEAIDLVGSIGRAVLEHLMPDRRLR
jgi:hypothetical protein